MPNPTPREKTEDIARRLKDAQEAYPEEVFPGPTDADREHHPDIVQRASAGMARHMIPLHAAAASHIAALESKLAWTEEFNRRLSHLLGEDEDKIAALEAEKAELIHAVADRNKTIRDQAIEKAEILGAINVVATEAKVRGLDRAILETPTGTARELLTSLAILLKLREQHPDKPGLYREKTQ